MTIREIIDYFGIGKTTYYRYVNENKNANNSDIDSSRQ